MTPSRISRLVKNLARGVGFDAAGIAPAVAGPGALYYRDWLAAGYAGQMSYMHKHAHLRADPARLLPGAKSIICAALSYNPGPEPDPDDQLSDRPPFQGGPHGDRNRQPRPPAGLVARYARGRDYHLVLRDMLTELVTRLRAALGEPFEHRICVDTAPLLERDVAARAGLGWIGKNTMLIHRRLGSYILLGECLTTLEIEPDAPETDHCGRCTRCLEACPTGALVEPYRLDARRCISYLTIESREPVEPHLQAAIGRWVFGCDICQEVCPHNRRAPAGTNAALNPGAALAGLPLLELLELRSGQYRRLTRDSALRRATRRMLRRNAAVALGNVAAGLDAAGRGAARSALRRAADDADAAVRQSARAALVQLDRQGENG